ncbi:unnamed protein product, partial [Ixodes persulcatus]
GPFDSRLHPKVRLDVRHQRRLGAERLRAQVAREGPRPRVRHQVQVQAGLLRKRLATVSARERPLPRVGPQVGPEVAGNPEARRADATLVRLGAEVQPHVATQRNQLAKLVAAHVAAQGRRSDVAQPMKQHVVLVVVVEVAQVAAEGVHALPRLPRGLVAAAVGVGSLFLVI